MSQQESSKKIHQGRNIKRFREMLGIKQEAFAAQLGEDWSQRRVSLLEAKEEVDEDILLQVASALKVPKEAIENFDEQAAICNIQNNYEGANQNAKVDNGANYHDCSFNPLDKVVELYERMIKDRDAMIEELKKLNK